jgi:hypothetical protein
VLTRPLWLAFGLIATGLGIAGVVLPLLPATPFLLLAAFAFARSSPRLHAWLVQHPVMGRLISDWNAYGAIDRRAKLLSIVLMVVTLAGSALAGVTAGMLVLQGALMSGAALFILTRPDGPSGA